ncbi:MAG: hypothetical protein JO117_06995 [Verrucomicrobia bacterium]|nr:hypothetical protein [Verrucomicrobiota bacterium]
MHFLLPRGLCRADAIAFFVLAHAIARHCLIADNPLLYGSVEALICHLSPMTTKKKKARDEPTAVSPVKSAVEELRTLRQTFDAVIANYASRIQRELADLIVKIERLERTEEGAPRKNVRLDAAQLRDLRDMVSLLRRVEVRPEKGRRKDVKKLDTLVGDLHLLSEHWS